RTPAPPAAAASARRRRGRRVPAAPAAGAGRTGWRSSRRRRARRSGPEGDLDRPRYAAAFDDDGDLVAGLLGRDDGGQLRRVEDALAADVGDHVTNAQPGADRGAGGDEACDLRTGAALAGVRRLRLDAQVGPLDSPALLQD